MESSPLQIGTITTWIGATLGGSTSPLSSPWTITTAPTIRVVMPHEVFQTYSHLPDSFWYLTSNALAKLCPRWWLVPACRARLSCISASIV